MIIPLGFAQVTHFFSGDGLPNGAAVVYGVEADLAPDPCVAAETIHGEFWDNLGSLVTVNVVLDSTLFKLGPNDTGNFCTFSFPRAGTAAGDADSPNVALLLEKSTQLGGREGRGRMYLPGVPAPNIFVDGDLSSSYIDLVNIAAASLIADLTTVNFPMVVLHNSLTEPSEVTTLRADGTVATQRRRLRS